MVARFPDFRRRQLFDMRRCADGTNKHAILLLACEIVMRRKPALEAMLARADQLENDHCAAFKATPGSILRFFVPRGIGVIPPVTDFVPRTRTRTGRGL